MKIFNYYLYLLLTLSLFNSISYSMEKESKESFAIRKLQISYKEYDSKELDKIKISAPRAWGYLRPHIKESLSQSEKNIKAVSLLNNVILKLQEKKKLNHITTKWLRFKLEEFSTLDEQIIFLDLKEKENTSIEVDIFLFEESKRKIS